MNLKHLEQEREIASIDQKRLSMFYESHWQSLIDEIESLREEIKSYIAEEYNRQQHYNPLDRDS